MKIRKSAVLTAAIIALLILLPSCTNSEKNEDDKINISVTIAPEKEFAARVAGDTANINVVVPTGADPESYEPGVNEIKSLADADIYFTVGVPSEENSILPMLSSKTDIFHLEDEVENQIPDLHIGDERDPHIWLSADRAVIMVEKIRDVLTEKFPENAALYEDNAASYIEEIREAKSYAAEKLSTLENRTIIVYHPAFGYFADEHALTMLSLENEGKEATVKDLTALIDYARENEIKAIFYQEESSGKQAKTFSDEIGGSAVMLSPLSENYVESYRETADKIKEYSK